MFHRQILFLFLIFVNIINILAKETICISLGGGCGPALMLRDLKIRKEAFPFDWVVSPFESLYQALITDFEFFLKDLKMRPDMQGVIDHYGINYTHDWPTTHNPKIDPLNVDFVPNCKLISQWEQALPSVRAKYQRRIERLQKICFSDNKAIFIRTSATKEQTIRLRDFFKNKYPLLDFVLIVLLPYGDLHENWNIDCVKNIYVKGDWDTSGLVNILKTIDPVTFSNVHPPKKKVLCDSLSAMACQECLLSLDTNASCPSQLPAQ